jgi:decaprenyl-phosphate phosphoribosyltransferase
MTASARAAAPPSAVAGLVRAMRPRQWSKNVLVAAAPAAAGVLESSLAEVGIAFVSLCLVSSGTYLLNDLRDVEADRAHPTKRYRPVASGVLAPSVALAAGLALAVGGVALAGLLGPAFVAVVTSYLALTVSYTVWLKHIPVLDIIAVASGFIVRAVAGGVAVDVPLSRWFLIVASFGSLFMVAGKRHGEHIDLNGNGAGTRPVLGVYTAAYLRYVWTTASGVVLAAYCLWAFEQAQQSPNFPGYELSIIPFVAWILRYALLIETGKGGTPEEIVLGDRTLLILTAVWAALFGCGVYLGR